MKVLYVMPRLEGDPEDNNHFRVEHHHDDGLTLSDVLLVTKMFGMYTLSKPRKVRSCSRVHGRKGYASATILVHLKPLPAACIKRMQCKHVDTRAVLSNVGEYTTVDLMLQHLGLISLSRRLLQAKLRNMVRKGLLSNLHGRRTHFGLTPKGRQLLESTT